jgi:GAF domain-containing protein
MILDHSADSGPKSGIGLMETSRKLLRDFSRNLISVAAVHQAVCEDIVRHVGSTRASIWYFNDLKDRITCACLLDSRTGRFDSGTELHEDDFPQYFEAIRSHEIINAPDALTHPATRCFDEIYFSATGIVSLLDRVITVRRQHTAILCCEHCDEPRRWRLFDHEYLRHMAILLRLSLLVEQRPRRAGAA